MGALYARKLPLEKDRARLAVLVGCQRLQHTASDGDGGVPQESEDYPAHFQYRRYHRFLVPVWFSQAIRPVICESRSAHERRENYHLLFSQE